MNNLRCPQCGLSHIKRNGYTHYGKQNYRCKDCDRQFVEDSQHIGEEVKDLIKVLLLERLSLRGICRVTRVSLTWLLDFIAEVYAESPDDLNVKVCQARGVVQLLRLEAEADEMWSFACPSPKPNPPLETILKLKVAAKSCCYGIADSARNKRRYQSRAQAN